jgi:hypothetical protein
MSDLPEGVAPESATAQALAELGAQGHTITADNTPTFDGEDIVETPIEEKTEATPEVTTPPEQTREDPKPEREIAYVPAWKLKTAESQKSQAEKRVTELEAELKRYAENPDKKTEANEVRQEISDLVKEFPDVDPRFFELIDKKYGAPLETVKRLEAEQNKTFQELSYAKEFDKDIVPLIKAENPNVSETALLQIKDTLRNYAFTEEYGKLALAKIFKAERDSLNIPEFKEGRKTSEDSRSGTIRAADTIDFDNVSEAQFLAMSDDDKLKFGKYQAQKNRK